MKAASIIALLVLGALLVGGYMVTAERGTSQVLVGTAE